jgi:hypothetical protein
MLNFRRSYCIITASGIVTLCKRLYIMPVESGLRGVRPQPAESDDTDAVIIQYDLLKMSILLLETCGGL